MLSKKRKIIIIVTIASAFFCLGALVTAALVFARPCVMIEGDKNISIPVFSKYEATEVVGELNVFGLRFKLKVKSDGKVNTDKLGEYKTTHSIKFLNKTAEAQRTVTVIDTQAPIINIEHPDFIFNFEGTPATPEDITISFNAIDNYDGDLTAHVQKTVEDKICKLTVTDTSGNTATAEINIVYNDGVNPTIALTGPSTVYAFAEKGYTEAGYSAKDNLDGDITSLVKVREYPDAIDATIYYREYSVSDAAGNTAKVTRKIIVYGSKTAEDYKDVVATGKTVYLTFDDGPGAYTEKLLGYLDRYGVKATFFVTNQFPRYQHLIKESYNRGHKIAIHTLTHQWSVYNSVDSFMADFNGIQNVILEQTGKETNIFRFPGGTNNAISKSHCKGIMTQLSNLLTEQGYTYFDWNVDCNDSRDKDSQRIITDTISQISRKSNAVVLMHDIKNQTVEAVPAIIEHCLQNGYTFKTLDENSPAVRYNPAN